jgi:hypothetical protein
MKKMTLDVDALRVESFEMVAARGGRGTVRAHDSGCTAPPDGTCVDTCGNRPQCTDVDGTAMCTLYACCV